MLASKSGSPCIHYDVVWFIVCLSYPIDYNMFVTTHQAPRIDYNTLPVA